MRLFIISLLLLLNRMHTHYLIFFGNNSSAMRRTQILMSGLLLRTARRIHGTHSNFGGLTPVGDGSAFMFVCRHFCVACRPNGLIFKYFDKTWELITTESSQRAMTFSAGGQVVTWGLDFGGAKFSPSEKPGKNCA